jgi:hypothetical protein
MSSSAKLSERGGSLYFWKIGSIPLKEPIFRYIPSKELVLAIYY